MSEIKRLNIGRENQALFILPALLDNYIYLLTWETQALVIDPGEGQKVLDILEKYKLKLISTLVTHHHADHVGGVELLKEKTHCHVIGPEDGRLFFLDQVVNDQEELIFGPFKIEILSTPGHTQFHLGYFFSLLQFLFSGDLLFGGGCGRLFEGTLKQMYSSLEKVKKLPEETALFFGHEYTLKNLKFAAHIEPKNKAILKRLCLIEELRQKGGFSVPSSLAIEKETNPFLRLDNPQLKKALKMEGADAFEIFSRLRFLRDDW